MMIKNPNINYNFDINKIHKDFLMHQSFVLIQQTINFYNYPNKKALKTKEISAINLDL